MSGRLLRHTAGNETRDPRGQQDPRGRRAARLRELALPLGFVDVKVCAVDEVWSGLKLVVRKELR